MNEPKFTPGPWRVQRGTMGQMSGIIAPKDYRIGWVLTEATHKQVRETDMANAALIAAAPELYEALKLILKRIDDSETCPYTIRDETKRLRAALAKAEGKKKPWR